jgi:Peptidase family M23
MWNEKTHNRSSVFYNMFFLNPLTLSFIVTALLFFDLNAQVYLPIQTENRHSIKELTLTNIGQFGLRRKARPNIPSHYHTGIDIKRPHQNYHNEPIYPIAKGLVISKRIDGPYAQLIIEHDLNGIKVWSLYEHIAGICVDLHSSVDPLQPIARFMNSEELKEYGSQFDHFHLEILRIKPTALNPTSTHPDRIFGSYSLICFSEQELKKYFYNPLEFLDQ